MVVVHMGDVVDYYRPTATSDWCSMLLSQDRFEWSADGIRWEIPSYSEFSAFGGSAAFWPSENQAYPDDQRKFLSFWGGSTQTGGCCKTDYDSSEDSWGQPFTMYACNSTMTLMLDAAGIPAAGTALAVAALGAILAAM
jgi:hypothetical protein